MATAEVEIDIFSGLPNPTWTLSDGQTASLLEMIAGLPPAEPAAHPETLGYRGMIVRVHGTPAREVDAHDGVVVVNGVGHADPDRRVERRLLDSGRPFMPPTVYDIVAGEL